jgi:NAD(P)H-dependent flavin oxidoreductase YrpB (nitropropane dioxygenase family)
MGAQGVWCGTIWLGTRESELDEFERQVLIETGSDGTVRRKARTGKTVRMIRSELSEAWEQPGAPAYLPTPLQGVLYNEAHARVVRSRRKELYSFPVGQSVGAVSGETTVADLMYRLQLEYGEAMERLAAFL